MNVRRVLLSILVAGLATTSLAASAQTEPSPAATTVPPVSLDEAALLEPAVDVGALPSAPATAPVPVTESAPVPPEPTAPAVARSSTGAMDTLDLGTTSITGNQELPKVLYIVPWKQSDLGDVVGRPVNTLLDEVLAPIDPEVFERQLGYYDTLREESREE